MNKLRALFFLAFASPLAFGCNSEGACVMPSGSDEICTIQKKGVCEQGKGHRFLGGDCAAAGYASKTGDGIWEKKK